MLQMLKTQIRQFYCAVSIYRYKFCVIRVCVYLCGFMRHLSRFLDVCLGNLRCTMMIFSIRERNVFAECELSKSMYLIIKQRS